MDIFGRKGVLVLAWDAVTESHRRGDLNLFLVVLEAAKSKVKVLADSVFWGGPASCTQVVPSQCLPMARNVQPHPWPPPTSFFQA